MTCNVRMLRTFVNGKMQTFTHAAALADSLRHNVISTSSHMATGNYKWLRVAVQSAVCTGLQTVVQRYAGSPHEALRL